RQVYIPVFRQLGASTLAVVDTLKGQVRDMTERLTRGGIALEVVMDQSVYVRRSIESLIEEGVLGAVLCSLVILVFLGEWRMMPGLGECLFRPTAMAVAFAMVSAYILSRSFVPSRGATWLRPHAEGRHAEGGRAAPRRGLLARGFARWEAAIEAGIRWYLRRL